jgi:hypothetical protein
MRMADANVATTTSIVRDKTQGSVATLGGPARLC